MRMTLRRLVFGALCCAMFTVEVAAQRGGQTRGTTGRGATAGYSTEARQYRSNTMMGDAMIEIDPETRTLIVVTDDETNLQIKQVIDSLDRPKPQVLLEVLFLEVKHRDELDFGVEGSYTYRNNGTVGSIGTDMNLDAITQGGFGQIISDDWSVTIRALAEQGFAKVLSRPSILARNNQEAIIVVGQEVPFVTNSQINNLGNTINTIQYGQIGIILRVTPYITNDEHVEMIVHPEISNLSDETFPISETVESPIINTREAETVVVTPNRKTVVIGGLIDTIETKAVRKVPVLGDIPVLGTLFRRTIKKDEKTELLIFLTPTIINTPGDLLGATKKRIEDSELVREAVPEADLRKYLDSLTIPNTEAELEEYTP